MQDIKAVKRKKTSGGVNSKILITLFLFIALVVVIFLKYGKNAKALFNPISIIASVNAATLKETDGRTNILVLGSDRRSTGPVTSVLTDTIILASIGKIDGDVVLISIPRDLWVSEYNAKINAIYAEQDVEKVRQTVAKVLGIPVHYYVVVDFDLFKETINTVEGVEITVDQTFDDYLYPIAGKENDTCGRSAKEIEGMKDQADLFIYPCRFEYLHFEVGMQKMDSELALKFVRSRHGNNGENTDFARAKRQQKLIVALKNKVLSTQTLFNLSKIKGLYDAFSKNIESDIDFPTIQGFYLLSQQVTFSNIKPIILDDRSASDTGGLLYAPTGTSLYGGAYVLIPRAGDFSQLHAYVQKYLFGK